MHVYISPAQKCKKYAGLVLDKFLENIEISTILNNYRTKSRDIKIPAFSIACKFRLYKI